MKYFSDKENIKLLISIILTIIIGSIIIRYSFIIGLLFMLLLSILFIFAYIKRRDQRVNNLYEDLRELNSGNYSYNFKAYEEGELAKLQNELEKTTITINNMNHKLISQQDALEEGLENIAHQLKTPISSLILLNELQEENELVTKSHDQLQRLNYLSNSLLKLIRLDANLETFDIETININNLIESALNLSNIQDKELVLNIENEIIRCDFLKTQEALINILTNKKRHAYSTITIETFEKDLSSCIKISDDGERIDADLKHSIFDRFFSGTNKDSKSIGIGLSIAKEYIERQDGKLYVEGDNTFVIKLPRI